VFTKDTRNKIVQHNAHVSPWIDPEQDRQYWIRNKEENEGWDKEPPLDPLQPPELPKPDASESFLAACMGDKLIALDQLAI
jgi:hypothetical protein